MDDEIGKEIVKQGGAVLGKVYDDLAHPTAKSIGITVSFLPRTIGVWLGKWEKWIVNGEESIRLTAQAVREKAEAIPPEKLTEPEPYVAIPAIQQLSYCYDSEELREMYANLLVSSMNIDTKHQVHPSFVDVIKQLTPDEARLLKCLSFRDIQPIIDVCMEAQDGSYQIEVHNFTSISDDVCDDPSGIFAYLDNLERLKLIHISYEVQLREHAAYKPLEEYPSIKNLMSESVPPEHSRKIRRGTFNLTSFGKGFIKICIAP